MKSAWRSFPLALAIQFVAAAFFLDLTLGSSSTTLLAVPVVAVLALVTVRSATPGRRAARLALSGAIAVASVVAIEVAFRGLLLEPAVPDDDARFEAEIASRWPVPIPLDRRPEALRIVALGDSFGWSGRESNHLHLLPGLLPGRPVEIVNLSLPQIGPADELLLFERFGVRYRPDLVLHGFFVGNDFLTTRLTTCGGIGLEGIPGPVGWLPRHFALRRWCGRWARSRGPGTYEMVEDTEGRPHVRFAEEVFDAIEAARLAVCRPGADPAARWGGVVAILDRLRRSVEAAGARYVLVLHPDQFQVEPAVRARALARLEGVEESDLDVELPQRFLTRWAADHGVPCLDLLPPLGRSGSGGGLYLERNTHYAPAGHRLAAEAIADWLAEEGLIEKGLVDPSR